MYDDSLYAEPKLLRTTVFDKLVESVAEGVEACAPYVQASTRTARRAAKRVNALKEEKPLQFLGAIAASAFTLGMVVRFWRSRS